MAFMRHLAGTDISVSALGLGTVKIGRDQGVKYPTGFTIPDDAAVRNLLATAHDLGINLLDTAPAYGSSETRLGQLLGKRQDWVIVTKTGEEFANGESHFDFSAAHTRMSIERSLKRLNTDYLDMVLIHSNGDDEGILNQTDCVATLRQCQQEGLVRVIGMSTKTEAGGVLAASLLDVVMITYNLEQRDQAVLDYAQEKAKGVLIKKGLMSGHAGSIPDSMALLMQTPGITSAIVGTITPAHLAENVALARKLAEAELPEK